MIHGCVATVQPSAVQVATGATSTLGYTNAAPSVQENQRLYNYASISAQQSLRINWLPYDNCDVEFVPFSSVNPDDTCYGIFSTIVGTAASAPIRIDIYENYEIMPLSGTILTGLEDFAKERAYFRDIWWDLLNNYQQSIVTADTNLSSVVSASYLDHKNKDNNDGVVSTAKPKMKDIDIVNKLNSSVPLNTKEAARLNTQFKKGIIKRDGISYILTEG
jgi:hypothetical protein